MSEDTNLINDEVYEGMKTWVTISVRGNKTYTFEGDPFPSRLTDDYILTYGAAVLDPNDYTINVNNNSITIDEPTMSKNLKIRLYYFGSGSGDEELEGMSTWVTTSRSGTRVYKFTEGTLPSDDTSKYILTYGAAVLDPGDYYINLSNNSIVIDEPTQTPGLKIRLYYFSGDLTTASQIKQDLEDIKNRLDTLESEDGNTPDDSQPGEGGEVVPASTMTPSRIVTTRVTANEVFAGRFTLNNKTVFNITDNWERDDTKTLPTSYALRRGILSIVGNIDSIRKEVDRLSLTPVMSDSIIGEHFQDEHVTLNNFTFDLTRIIYGNNSENVNENQAYVLVTSEAFSSKGNYFVDFIVDKLPGDSTITITDEKNNIVYEATDPGEHRFEINVENPSTSYLLFNVNNVPAYDEVVLSYLGIHHIKDQFTTYMDYAAEKILADGSSFVTVENYQQGLKDTIEKSQEYTNTSVNVVTESINDHVNNKDNPHGVTCEKIGAAEANHTHTPTSIGAADKIHTHMVDDVSGVAREVHTHTPDECGAAPIEHTHTTEEITDLVEIITPIYDKIDEVENSTNGFDTKIEEVAKTINDHLIDQENPHGTTLGTLGYTIATDAEAVDGVLETAIMTPKTTKAVCASILEQVTSGVLPLEPTYIANITLNRSDNNSLSVPIQKDKIYQLIVKGDPSYLNNTKIYINTEDENLTYNTTFTLATNRILTDNDGNSFTLDYTTWNTEVHPYFLFLGSTSGTNEGNGVYTLDTKNLFMSGHGDGYITIDGTRLSNVRYPFSTNCSANFSIVDMEELNLVFDVDTTKVTTNGNINIFIYEMIPLSHDPTMVIDATPIGNIISRYGNSYIPGYSLIDGSELNKNNHLELFNYASENNLFVTVEEYNNEITANGYTSSFGYDDGNDTFFLPVDKLPTDNLYRYIKISKTTIPNDTDLLYRYVWN